MTEDDHEVITGRRFLGPCYLFAVTLVRFFDSKQV